MSVDGSFGHEIKTHKDPNNRDFNHGTGINRGPTKFMLPASLFDVLSKYEQYWWKSSKDGKDLDFSSAHR